MKEIVSTVTRKGQVTIPVEIRRRLGIRTPDKVAFVIEDDEVKLQPARYTWESVRGVIKPIPDRKPPTDFEDEIYDAAEEWAERVVEGMGGL